LRDDDGRAVHLHALEDPRLVAGTEGIEQRHELGGFRGCAWEVVHHAQVPSAVEGMIGAHAVFGNELHEPVFLS